VSTKIGILFGQFDEVAQDILSYLLIYQSTQQKSFEFIILSCPEDDPFVAMLCREPAPGHAEARTRAEEFFDRIKFRNESAAKEYELKASQCDKLVLLTDTAFSDNYYYIGDEAWGVIALGGWENEFAPPSIVEYYLSFVVAAAIESVVSLATHFETRGCISDFNRTLSDARFSVLTGHICEVCERKIKTQASIQAFDDAKTLLVRKWLGNSSWPSDVAVTVKKMGYDLFQTSGIKQTWKERWLSVIEQEGLKNFLNITFQIILVAALIALNLKSKK
jgi:hypothetical protein